MLRISLIILDVLRLVSVSKDAQPSKYAESGARMCGARLRAKMGTACCTEKKAATEGK